MGCLAGLHYVGSQQDTRIRWTCDGKLTEMSWQQCTHSTRSSPRQAGRQQPQPPCCPPHLHPLELDVKLLLIGVACQHVDGSGIQPLAGLACRGEGQQGEGMLLLAAQA